MEADNRSFHPESLHCEDPVSDGDHPVGPAIGSSKRLDGPGGSEGWLSSDSHSSFKPQVSLIRCGGARPGSFGSFVSASPWRLRFLLG